MPLHDHYTLPNEDQRTVDPGWFDSQIQRWSSSKHGVLRSWLDEEVKALKAFHDGTTEVEETAHAISRPISTSSVPSLGTYSDESVALTNLWNVLTTALMEWPSVRIPDLFALIGAMGKVPDKIHLGEATDSKGEQQLTWATHPYLGMVWYEASSLQPGEIVQQSPDAPALEKARAIFLKQRDIEAQLWAKHFIGQDEDRIMKYIIRALEGTPDKSVPRDNVTAHEQIRLEFHVPAVGSWMQYAGPEIYKHVGENEGGMQRWTLWEKRLQDIAEQESDERTKAAAASALKHMEDARPHSQ